MNSREGDLPKKTTHPNKNSLHKQFAQTLSACFLLILEGKRGGHPKLFVQTVLLFGWVDFLGGSPLHDELPRTVHSKCCSFLLSLFLCFFGSLLSGPILAMPLRCAMRFELHTPKSPAMRKSFFASDAKTHWLDLKSQENARKKACENPAMLAWDVKNRGVF